MLCVQFIQVIGWSMWFSEYLFLERNWAKDESIIKVLLQQKISEYVLCMCVYIYACTNPYIRAVHIDLFQFFMTLYLQSGLLRLKDYPQPFWLALFVEGTRFTQAKLLAAQEYATASGLPVPRNVLIPRTKVKFSSHLLLRHEKKILANL